MTAYNYTILDAASYTQKAWGTFTADSPLGQPELQHKAKALAEAHFMNRDIECIIRLSDHTSGDWEDISTALASYATHEF